MYAQNVRTARPSRLIGGILAAALQLALVVVVWTGFSPQIVRSGVQTALTSLDLRTPPPPPPPPPPRSRPRRPAHAASGRAAPPHARAHATPVVAPAVPPLKPVPVVAAKFAGTGTQSAQGAALAGQGSGAGGEGQGTGSGGAGNGEGAGGDGAELIRGEIRNSDIPQSLRSAPFSGTTRTTIAVDANGRVSGCRIVRSSGNSLLDDLTCRLIFQRFRFNPARDDQGRPEPDTIDYDQEWTITGKFGDLQGGQ